MMITTVDNPYSPRTDYVKWMQWDQEHGYYTAEYLARIAIVNDSMDDLAQEKVIEQAQMEIMDADVIGLYKLV